MATSPNLVGSIVGQARQLCSSNTEQQSNVNVGPSEEIQSTVFEFKTFSGATSLNQVQTVEQNHGRFIEVDLFPAPSDLACDEHFDTLTIEGFATKLFCDVVPWPAYRYQLLHHASVFHCDVMFVAADLTEVRCSATPCGGY